MVLRCVSLAAERASLSNSASNFKRLPCQNISFQNNRVCKAGLEGGNPRIEGESTNIQQYANTNRARPSGTWAAAVRSLLDLQSERTSLICWSVKLGKERTQNRTATFCHLLISLNLSFSSQPLSSTSYLLLVASSSHRQVKH